MGSNGQWQIGNLKPYQRGTCRAFFDVTMPPGIELRGFSLHEKDGKRWVSFPSTPKLDPDGVAARDEESGKVKYFPTVYFPDKDLYVRFSNWAAAEAFKLLPQKAAPAPAKREVVEDDGSDIPF